MVETLRHEKMPETMILETMMSDNTSARRREALLTSQQLLEQP